MSKDKFKCLFKSWPKRWLKGIFELCFKGLAEVGTRDASRIVSRVWSRVGSKFGWKNELQKFVQRAGSRLTGWCKG